MRGKKGQKRGKTKRGSRSQIRPRSPLPWSLPGPDALPPYSDTTRSLLNSLLASVASLAHLKGVYSRICITHAHLALHRTRAIYALSPERTLSIVSVFTFDHVPLRPSAVYVHLLLSPTLLVQRRPAFGSSSASLELYNAYHILFRL